MFVHEMVRIDQTTPARLFGIPRVVLRLESLATIIKRAIAGDPIEVMKESHEREAHELEKRFVVHP